MSLVKCKFDVTTHKLEVQRLIRLLAKTRISIQYVIHDPLIWIMKIVHCRAHRLGTDEFRLRRECERLERIHRDRLYTQRGKYMREVFATGTRKVPAFFMPRYSMIGGYPVIEPQPMTYTGGSPSKSCLKVFDETKFRSVHLETLHHEVYEIPSRWESSLDRTHFQRMIQGINGLRLATSFLIMFYGAQTTNPDSWITFLENHPWIDDLFGEEYVGRKATIEEQSAEFETISRMKSLAELKSTMRYLYPPPPLLPCSYITSRRRRVHRKPGFW